MKIISKLKNIYSNFLKKAKKRSKLGLIYYLDLLNFGFQVGFLICAFLVMIFARPLADLFYDNRSLFRTFAVLFFVLPVCSVLFSLVVGWAVKKNLL